ncbi:hypothetical protein MRB53_017516 [Persea americana]|uniref:Uncharacterized protein n=1 Tax=Persea americana TaxID=3435 RepID=A0ACC2M588_PERAE|nr:hypothetical protein MRB53_017516 [Persea americana]
MRQISLSLAHCHAFFLAIVTSTKAIVVSIVHLGVFTSHHVVFNEIIFKAIGQVEGELSVFHEWMDPCDNECNLQPDTMTPSDRARLFSGLPSSLENEKNGPILGSDDSPTQDNNTQVPPTLTPLPSPTSHVIVGTSHINDCIVSSQQVPTTATTPSYEPIATYQPTTTSSAKPTIELTHSYDPGVTPQSISMSLGQPTLEPSQPHNRAIISQPTSTPFTQPTIQSSHIMTTRSKDGISKPNPKYALLTSTVPTKPKTVKSALKNDGWKAAMIEEMKALATN